MAMHPVRFAIAVVTAGAAAMLTPCALAAPKGAPPTSPGDLARPDWAEGAPVIVEPEEARRRIVACGVEARRVSKRDDEALRETVLTVAGGAALSDEQLACLAGVSLDTSYQIIVAADLAARYGAAYARLDKERTGAAR